MPRTRYKIYEEQRPHFLTCTVVNWLPAFNAPPIAQILLDSWTFLQAEGRLTLYAYVIMVNHIHLVAVSPHLTKELAALSPLLPARSSTTTKKRTPTAYSSNWRNTSSSTRRTGPTGCGRRAAIRS